MNTISFSAPWQSPASFLDREWLITNGLGGYASGTLAGVNTRRYHGLFLPNLVTPKGRHLLLSRLEEELQFTDAGSVHLGAVQPPAADAAATSMQWLDAIHIGSNTAHWIYKVQGRTIEKTIAMPHLRNTVHVRYRLLDGDTAMLKLRPFTPLRRQDAELGKAHEPAPQVQNLSAERIEFSQADKNLLLRLWFVEHPVKYVAEPQAVTDLLLREKARGQAYEESIISPGYFLTELSAGKPIHLIASVEEWDHLTANFDSIIDEEVDRIKRLVAHAQHKEDEMVVRLTIAADQFLIRPENRPADAAQAKSEGHLLRSVIAGYHWFGDWGRDTMISLEGLMLCTGRYAEAKATLLTFAQYVRDGLLPNLFPEGEQAGLYHTVDASLWYFHAVQRYIHYTQDDAILTHLMPVLRNIIEHHMSGTRFGIHMDTTDGLIRASSPLHPLTWMDAHMGDLIFTPRRGKPVEIQALWYNALRLMCDWESSSETLATLYAKCARQVYASFNARFWNAAAGCLFDVVDGVDGNDASLRPNQIFAISLDKPVLAPERWRSVLTLVQAQLLTPYGLRTLGVDNPAYRPTYYGDLATRDAAYHQGTVWPWLIGHFIDAWLKLDRDATQARSMLGAFPAHLAEAGVGTISEVFDAQLPHVPHGCIAQAWSVAEVLRAWLRTDKSLENT
jgi:predicted glycogen debranching enzyme